jgi:hypothetical protein
MPQYEEKFHFTQDIEREKNYFQDDHVNLDV